MNDTPEPAETLKDQASEPSSGKSAQVAVPPVDGSAPADGSAKEKPKEIGGPKGPEPTRFGDWERKGRCIDF
ncbi:MAG: succinate dehydrogenase assembly factor 4 [Rhodospirillales bacterium]